MEALTKTVTMLTEERETMEYKFMKLQHKVTALYEHSYEVDESLTSLEKELARLAQYGRRESNEILNIPSSVKIEQREGKVIEILHHIGVKVESKDIIAVHRLKGHNNGKHPSTIVRFVNRKHAFLSLKNKRQINISEEKMGLKHLFIIENLCPVYKQLFEKCRNLKKENRIKHLWTHNGTINIRFTDDRKERPLRLYHEEDYLYNFEDYETHVDSSYSEVD